MYISTYIAEKESLEGWLAVSRGVDREYNLYLAVREVGFSQQAVGMIPSVAQCGERDHRDDIPTLLTVSHRLAKPTATKWRTVKSPPGLQWVHHSGRVGWKSEGNDQEWVGGERGTGRGDIRKYSVAVWSGFNVLIKTDLIPTDPLCPTASLLAWTCQADSGLREKGSFCSFHWKALFTEPKEIKGSVRPNTRSIVLGKKKTMLLNANE